MAELRRHLGKGLQYKVVKNTLARKAAEGTPVALAGEEYFKGPLGLAIGFDEPTQTVKLLVEFAGKNEKLKIQAGIVEGRLYGLGDLKGIAHLPSRHALMGMLAGAFSAPLGYMAGGLSATVVRFTNALNALRAKKETEAE